MLNYIIENTAANMSEFLANQSLKVGSGYPPGILTPAVCRPMRISGLIVLLHVPHHGIRTSLIPATPGQSVHADANFHARRIGSTILIFQNNLSLSAVESMSHKDYR